MLRRVCLEEGVWQLRGECQVRLALWRKQALNASFILSTALGSCALSNYFLSSQTSTVLNMHFLLSRISVHSSFLGIFPKIAEVDSSKLIRLLIACWSSQCRVGCFLLRPLNLILPQIQISEASLASATPEGGAGAAEN